MAAAIERYPDDEPLFEMETREKKFK